MARKPKPFQWFDRSAFPKEVQLADLLEKHGYLVAASQVRKSFNQRVRQGDPTTGVQPWNQNLSS